ncbi:DHH family phosphoesterase, partial [Patescibacteria group bacterium]|nr:DHH family phosphoesterase [Patescibacteria group bacterium]
QSQKILVMPSAPPDGDSLGAALALYLLLKKLEKEVTVVCYDPVPDVYQFLPKSKVIGDRVVASKDFIISIDCRKAQVETIKSSVETDKVNIIVTPKTGRYSEQDVSFNYGPAKYDLIIIVDAGSLNQLGKLYKDNIEMFSQVPVLNIDHHISNEQFGRVNYIDIMAASTTELLIPIVKGFSKEAGKELMDEDIATLLLAGIVTDTGSFQNANTTPKSFDNAAELVAIGARQQEIIQNVYKTKELSTLKLWGRILSKIKVDETHKIVWSAVSKKDFADTGSKEEATGDVIDELMTNAPGAEVVLLLKEKDNGLISGSVRTTTPAVDASEIAEAFGGGGHTQAAGFRIESTDLDKVEAMVIEKIQEYQKRRLGLIEKEPENEKSAWEIRVEEMSKSEESKKKKPKEKSKKLNLKSQPKVEIEPGVTYKFEDSD